MENYKNKKSVKFQGDMLNFCDFIQVFVFTRNHHLNLESATRYLFSFMQERYFSAVKSCLNRQYEESRPELLSFAYQDHLYMSNIRCFIEA